MCRSFAGKHSYETVTDYLLYSIKFIVGLLVARVLFDVTMMTLNLIIVSEFLARIAVDDLLDKYDRLR